MSAALDTALAYIARGWSPVPVGYREKKPKIDRWQKLRITADQRFGINGLPLASPLSGGNALVHRGNTGLYGVISRAFLGGIPKRVWVFSREPWRLRLTAI